MSEKQISTIEELKACLKGTVSEKRYTHSLGVASATEMLLDLYRCSDFVKCWNGFSAGEFCGLVHDFAREKSDAQILEYCRANSIELTREQIENPVLAHGCVSAHMAKMLVGDYPDSWYRAICVHTTGDSNMDDLGLALFAADFIEPNRAFLTDEKRHYYTSSESLIECEYRILCDLIAHWKKKGYHDASEGSLNLLKELEQRLGK